MAGPTYAEEAAPKAYDAVTTFKNVYERMNAAGVSKFPKEFFYASGTAPAQVYNAALKEEAGKHVIGIEGYHVSYLHTIEAEAGFLPQQEIREVKYFSIKANGTLDTTPPDNMQPWASSRMVPIAQRTNLYEVMNEQAGILSSLNPKVYVYGSVQQGMALKAYKQGDKYYLKLLDATDIYIAVAADGTLDCNDVIEKLGAAGEKVLYPLPAPVYKYKAVDNYKNLFEVLGADGKSKNPKEYIYSTKAPEEGKAPPAGSQQALVKGETFYVCFLDGSGIFLAVNGDGTLNYGNALWWGIDGQFGTKDDLVTSVKEESGYFYWQQAPGVWQMIQGIFNPNYTTATTTTTTAGPAYKYKAVENHKNLYEMLDADGKPKSPREYIYSETAPVDGSAPPAIARTAYVKGDYFYVPFVEDGGIFLAVNGDGTLNFSNAIWWGPDKKFGTSDDLDTSVMLDGGQYYWLQADGLWQLIMGLFHPEQTTTANPHLTTQESLPPKTGKEGLNPGVAVCMALLLMGCMYCGFQAFRRRTRFH